MRKNIVKDFKNHYKDNSEIFIARNSLAFIEMFKLIFIIVLAIGIMNVRAYTQEICPSVESQIGFLVLHDVLPAKVQPSSNASNGINDEPGFSAGLLGTQELMNNAVFGGMDWFKRNDNPEILPTTETGSQITTWWSQKDGKSTYIHITNIAQDDPNCNNDNNEQTQYVHVVVMDDSCNEIINFCDRYTPEDSHIYDLDALITNQGDPQGSEGLEDEEGIFVLTATTDCTQNPTNYPLDDHNFFEATVRIIDDIETDYGFNAYARATVDNGTESVHTGCNGKGLDNIGSSGSLDTLEKAFNTVTQTTPPADNGDGTGEPGSNDAVAGGDIILMNYTDDYNFASNSNSSYRPLAADTAYNSPVIYDHKELDASCPTFTGCFIHRGINNKLPLNKEFILEPPPEDCDVEGDEDEDENADCEDSDCIGSEPCESGKQCADDIDNDGVNGKDCLDPGCDGAKGPNGEICEAGFEATCDDGFDNDGDWATDDDDPDCQIDEDECSLGTDICDENATCTNITGGFLCSCNTGYSGDGLICNDEDECDLETDNCDENATCTNTDGSFECSCNEGYSGDGVSCESEDVDLIPSDDDLSVSIDLNSNSGGSGRILIDLPQEVKALAVSLVPDITSCQIANSSSASRIDVPDVVCVIEEFPAGDMELILSLCSEGDQSGVVEALVGVVVDNNADEDFETTLEIVLDEIGICRETAGDDVDSSGDNGGCSLASTKISKANAFGNTFVILLPFLLALSSLLIRRKKD